MKQKKKHDIANVKQINPDDVIFVTNQEISNLERTINDLERIEQNWIDYKNHSTEK